MIIDIIMMIIDADIDDHQYNNDDHRRCCSVAPKCWLVGLRLQLTKRFTVTSQPQIAKQNSRQIFKYLSHWVAQCRIVCNQSELQIFRADQSLQWKQILTKAVLDMFNCSIVQLFNHVHQKQGNTGKPCTANVQAVHPTNYQHTLSLQNCKVFKCSSICNVQLCNVHQLWPNVQLLKC